MHYEIQQHRAVVQRVSQMFTEGFTSREGGNPLTARARDAALYIFSRRPDIALGVSLQKTYSGGLRFDIVRHRHDFVFEISEEGHVYLVTSYTQNDPANGTIFSRSVHEDFFDRLDEVLTDPISNLKSMEMPCGLPCSGIMAGEAVTSDGEILKCIRTNDEIYVSWGFSSYIFHFNRIAVSIPKDTNLEPDALMATVLEKARSGVRNMMVIRDAGIGGFVALHRIDMFSESFCARLKFKSGDDLLMYQRTWISRNAAGNLGRGGLLLAD